MSGESAAPSLDEAAPAGPELLHDLPRPVLELVRDAVLVVDAQGAIVFANRSVERVLGWSPAEVVGTPVRRLLPAAAPTVHRQHRQHRPADLPDAAPSTAGRPHVQGVRKDGREIPVDVASAPLAVPGTSYDVLVVTPATSTRYPQGTEQHLVMSQRLARLGSWERDYLTGRVQWSAELYRLLGVDVGSVEPGWDAFARHLHPDDRAILEAEHRRAAVEGGSLFAVARALAPPRTFAVRGSIELDAAGSPLRAIGTVQDITEETARIRTPEPGAASSPAAAGQDPAGAAPIGMVLLDVRPGRPIRAVMANPAMADLMGVPHADLLERPLGSWVHPADRSSLGAFVMPVARGEEDGVRAVEVRVVRSDGEQRWTALDGSLVRDGDGAPEYVIVHVQDVTDRKLAELETRDRAARDAHIAAVLQDDLVPFVANEVGPVRVATRYLPAGEGELVGGDWIDAFTLPGGRIGVVVGDVAGHGVEAAATMSRLRAVVRLLATDGLGPAAVIRRLNDALHADPSSGVDMATLVHAQLDPATGVLRYSSAGHLPLLAVPARRGAPDPTVVVVPPPGDPPVGVVAGLDYRQWSVTLEPGGYLVGFTDGLVERRGRDLDDTLRALRDGIGRLHDDALASVDSLAGAVLALAPDGDAGDDLALIVLSVPPN